LRVGVGLWIWGIGILPVSQTVSTEFTVGVGFWTTGSSFGWLILGVGL
jgi:hypothetical protein